MTVYFYLFIFCTLLLVTVTTEKLQKDSVIEGTKLEMAFVILRHGDRTPLKESLRFIEGMLDMDQVEDLVAPLGWGQLTEEGKRTGYKAGEYIRRRYHDQLSWDYNCSEMYIRSTNTSRTRMTVMTALPAIYPQKDWDPVPYTTIPAKYDYLLYQVNCPIYMAVNRELMLAPSKSMVNNYGPLLADLTRMLGTDLTTRPALSYTIYDALHTLIPLGYELDPELLELMPELKNAAAEAMDIIYASEDHLNLISGPLLNEFFKEAAKVITKEETQKIRIYSSHDVNVYGFKAVTGVVNKQGLPGYGAMYSLELRRVVATGEYVVLPVYLETPEAPEIYLKLKGCENYLCPYETFYNMTSSNAISEAEWREQCDWSEDIVVDIDEFE